MKPAPLLNVPFDPSNTEILGSVKVDRRALSTGLSSISAGFAEWIDGAEMEPWTLPYEEAVYVISGELTISSGDTTVVGHAGDMITCERGVEQVASGTPGTRVFFASYPANWRETSDRPTVSR